MYRYKTKVQLTVFSRHPIINLIVFEVRQTLPRESEHEPMPEHPTIMVVDDDASIRKALNRLLRSAGLRAQAFASAREFLDQSDPEECQILVLDVRMPGMTGLALQKKLVDTGRDIPIIFISAHEDKKTKASALAAGAVAFLYKPFDEKVLLEEIQKAGTRAES